MKRRYVHRWAIWLLPLLLLRAFVPAGFMLAADSSGLSLVFCTTTTTLSEPEITEHSHHHHGGEQSNVDSSDPEEQSALCPFALAGTACSFEIAFLAGAIEAPAYDPPLDSSLPSSTGPLRADRIRGPPHLA